MAMGLVPKPFVTVRALASTTKLAEELVIEFAAVQPVAGLETVTVKGVVPAGVEAVVVIVRVEPVELLDTVVGLNAAVAPVGAVQLMTIVFEVQVLPEPLQVVVMA